MKYRVRHTTTYDYESPVVHGRHVVKKRPRSLSFQTVLQSSLRVEPRPVWTRQEFDYFGNGVDIVEVLEPHENLTVTAESDVMIGPFPIDTGLPLFFQSWEAIVERIARDPLSYEAQEMQLDSPLVRRHPLLSKFAEPTFRPGRPLLEAVLELNQRIHDEFTYDSGFSDVATPLGKVLREKRGVCQDFAHVAIGALRSLGLAARYVSGYLETRPPPGRPRLVGADASHAWASVYFPDYGWVSFDPTNNMLPRERHIVVAWGRDFSDVSPLRGVVHGGGRHVVSVAVDVDPNALGNAGTNAPPRIPEVMADGEPGTASPRAQVPQSATPQPAQPAALTSSVPPVGTTVAMTAGTIPQAPGVPAPPAQNAPVAPVPVQNAPAPLAPGSAPVPGGAVPVPGGPAPVPGGPAPAPGGAAPLAPAPGGAAPAPPLSPPAQPQSGPTGPSSGPGTAPGLGGGPNAPNAPDPPSSDQVQSQGG